MRDPYLKEDKNLYLKIEILFIKGGLNQGKQPKN